VNPDTLRVVVTVVRHYPPWWYPLLATLLFAVGITAAIVLRRKR